jgi:hypothetical protein
MRRAATVARPREPTGIQRPRVVGALHALEVASRKQIGEGGWIETGGVADALGVAVGEAAAALRAASRLGLCARRRSLVHGTVWKLTGAAICDSDAIEP